MNCHRPEARAREYAIRLERALDHGQQGELERHVARFELGDDVIEIELGAAEGALEIFGIARIPVDLLRDGGALGFIELEAGADAVEEIGVLALGQADGRRRSPLQVAPDLGGWGNGVGGEGGAFHRREERARWRNSHGLLGRDLEAGIRRRVRAGRSASAAQIRNPRRTRQIDTIIPYPHRLRNGFRAPRP